MKKHLVTFALVLLALGQAPRAGAAPAKGESAPDFTLSSLDGKESTTLSKLQGQVVYLDFWASWCGPCRRSFPEVEKLQADYQDQPFQVLALSLDRRPSDGLKYLQARNSPLKALYDEGGAVANRYGVRSIPSSFILGPDGTVAYSAVGFDPRSLPKIKSTIEALLENAEGGDAAPGEATPVDRATAGRTE